VGVSKPDQFIPVIRTGCSFSSTICAPLVCKNPCGTGGGVVVPPPLPTAALAFAELTLAPVEDVELVEPGGTVSPRGGGRLARGSEQLAPQTKTAPATTEAKRTKTDERRIMRGTSKEWAP
jgi:hypothetical protein